MVSKEIKESPACGIENRLSLCLVILRGMLVAPLGVCLRVIVNEKPLNLNPKGSESMYSLGGRPTPPPLEKGLSE